MLKDNSVRLGLGSGKNPEGDLDNQGEREMGEMEIEKNSILRDEVLRQTMLRIASVFLLILGSVLLLALSSFAWHKITPVTLHFLGTQQIDSIQTFLLSSAITSFILLIIRKFTK